MTVVIREATEGELDDVTRLLGAVFEQKLRPHSMLMNPAEQEAFKRYFEELVNVRGRRDDAELFVAALDGRIVGTGTLYPPGRGRHYARAIHTKPWPEDWASLRLLAVDSTHRGRGIGRMLLDARVRRARDLNASFVALHTSEAFADARRIFQRSGWERRPEFDHTPAPGVCAEAYALALA